MFKRTFKVVMRPVVKSNFVLLPDSYYEVVSTYVSTTEIVADVLVCQIILFQDNGCLQIQYTNGHLHYVSWATEGSSKDTEIAINARVAKEIGGYVN